MLSFMIFLGMGWVAGIVAHEGGHWLVGTLVGIPIRLATICTGPIVLQGQLGTVSVELRRLPLKGSVQAYPGVPRSRLALVAFMLGVLGNVLLLVPIALLVMGPLGDLVGPGLVCAQAVMICVTLYPVKRPGGGNDGYLIWFYLRRGTRWLATQTADYYAARLGPYRRAGHAENDLFSKASGRILRDDYRLGVKTQRHDGCRELLRELERGDARPDERLFILDHLWTRQLVHRDLDLLPRLDDLSALALRLAPDLATLRGTRGSALVELGRYDEARPMLVPLTEGSPSFDTILSRLFLARAEHGLGNTAEAQRLLDAARAAIAECPSDEARKCLAHAEAEIGATT